MHPDSSSRRQFLKGSAVLATPLLPAASAASPTSPAAAAEVTGRKLQVTCVGGHPDDPESGCAGSETLWRRQDVSDA